MTAKAALAGLLLLAMPCGNAVAQPSDFSASKTQVVSIVGPLNCCGGATVETNIASVRIPANSMGPSGAVDLKCLWSYPNSSNNKTLTTRIAPSPGSVSGGVLHGTFTVTTTASTSTEIIVRNIATNSQLSWAAAPSAPYGSIAPGLSANAVDTTADIYLNINGVTALGTETITLNHCFALIMRQ